MGRPYGEIVLILILQVVICVRFVLMFDLLVYFTFRLNGQNLLSRAEFRLAEVKFRWILPEDEKGMLAYP